MSYNQKRSYKSNFSNSKAVEAMRWDHSGFDQLQSEQNQGRFREEKNSKQNKSQNDPGHNPTSDLRKTMKPSNQREGLDGKWLHDKFDELENPNPRKSNQNTDQAQQRKKRPNQQLYNARERHNKESNSNDVSSQVSTNYDSTPRNKYAKAFAMKDDKDVLSIEDDSKSYTSNVSTAFSERIKPLDDDIFANRDSVYTDRPAERLFSSKKDDSHVLFEINLENDGLSDTIKIYDNEEDYDGFLDAICSNFGIKEEMALHFKIYLLYLIKQANPSDFQRIEPLYLRLLDENYELIMNDVGRSQFDDSLLDLADFDSQSASDKLINDQ